MTKHEISNSVFLEGGASLNFVYGIRRKFSNDFDFTVENKRLMKRFFEIIKKILLALDHNLSFKISQNKINIIRNGLSVFHVDCYELDQKYFDWELKRLTLDAKVLSIKTHTLPDIFAEKITNLSTRSEMNDITDISHIIEKYPNLPRKPEFKRIFKLKLEAKNLTKQDIAFISNNLICNNKYDREPLKCCKIIKEVYNEL